MTKERSRRFREKKELNISKSVHHVVSYFSLLPRDLNQTVFLSVRYEGKIQGLRGKFLYMQGQSCNILMRQPLPLEFLESHQND